MKIGPLDFGQYPLFLAPMEDVTDLIFRRLCKEYGADMVYTEFVNSDGLIRNVKKLHDKTLFSPDERPIGIQLYGQCSESMKEAALMAEQKSPDLIDINFGCPVKKIASRGAGSGMLKNIPLMVEITRTIAGAVKLPVTVKTRLGWDENSICIEEIAEKLQECGIQALTVHARTRSQLFKGRADWSWIRKIKDHPRIRIPIIGNGDIDSPEKAKEAFEIYHADGVMIGRAAIGRPWIFKEIKYFLQTGNKLHPLSVKEIVAVARQHFCQLIEYKGEKSAIYGMRRHFVHYFKGLPSFRDMKIKLLTSLDVNEIFHLLDQIAEFYGKFVPLQENIQDN